MTALHTPAQAAETADKLDTAKGIQVHSRAVSQTCMEDKFTTTRGWGRGTEIHEPCQRVIPDLETKTPSPFAQRIHEEKKQETEEM